MFRLALALMLISAFCEPALAEAVDVHQADAEQLRAAQKTFEVANELYDAGRFSQALTAFRASLDLVRSPNTRLMVARCLHELGRYSEALAAYSATERDAEASGGRYDGAAAAARAEREALAKLAYVVVRAPTSATVENVRVAQVDYGAMTEPIAVTAGEVIVSVRLRGEEQPIELRGHVDPGQTLELEAPGRPPAETAVEPAPPDVAPTSADALSASYGRLRVAAYAAGGVGALGFAGFAVFGTMSQNRYDELERNCVDGRCSAELSDARDEGKRYQTLANVGLAIGAVGVVAGTTLFVLSWGDDGESTARAVIGPGSVALRARF